MGTKVVGIRCDGQDDGVISISESALHIDKVLAAKPGDGIIDPSCEGCIVLTGVGLQGIDANKRATIVTAKRGVHLVQWLGEARRQEGRGRRGRGNVFLWGSVCGGDR